MFVSLQMANEKPLSNVIKQDAKTPNEVGWVDSKRTTKKSSGQNSALFFGLVLGQRKRLTVSFNFNCEDRHDSQTGERASCSLLLFHPSLVGSSWLAPLLYFEQLWFCDYSVLG